MKHFEEVWTEAESFQKEGNPDDRVVKLRQVLEAYEKNPPRSNEDKEGFLRKLMFELTGLSKDLDMNVAAALMKEIDERKIDTYG